MPCRRRGWRGGTKPASPSSAEAQLGPRHGARADPEGLRQHRLRGVAVQSAAAQTAVAPGFVVEGVGGDRLQEQEVDELLVIAHQAQVRP